MRAAPKPVTSEGLTDGTLMGASPIKIISTCVKITKAPKPVTSRGWMCPVVPSGPVKRRTVTIRG